MVFAIKQPKQKDEKAYELKQKAQTSRKFLIDKDEYQGWSNYNTWKVALNVDNDQPLYEESWRAIKAGEIKDGESFKEWFKENSRVNEDGFYKVSDSWSERELDADVNWDELYASKIRDIKEDEEYRMKKGM
jgi:hypothetical protein